MAEYGQYYVVEAAGWRVGLAKCLTCGATVLVEDKSATGGTAPATELHDQWHASQPEPSA